jgi:branched-chain amino acid transport system substrate-binding protein
MGGVHWEATGGMCEYEMTLSTIGRVMITDKTIPFYDKFVDKHEQFPIWTAGSYEAVHILKGAIERAGTIETYAVLEELQQTDHYGVAGRIVFHPPGHETPHDVRWGPGYVTAVGIQWMRGEPVVVWPDGWEGINYEGTVDYKLPPWMVEYWRGRS